MASDESVDSRGADRGLYHPDRSGIEVPERRGRTAGVLLYEAQPQEITLNPVRPLRSSYPSGPPRMEGASSPSACVPERLERL